MLLLVSLLCSDWDFVLSLNTERLTSSIARHVWCCRYHSLLGLAFAFYTCRWSLPGKTWFCVGLLPLVLMPLCLAL